MDSSDEEDLLLLLAFRRRKKRRRTIWCREHFLLRSERGEFERTFCSLMTRKDETLFFNYMRMSYDTYDHLKSLILPHLQPTGSNWRTSISAEEKLVLTLRYLATGSSFSSMSVPFHMSLASISIYVMATCRTLWDVLAPLELPEPNEDQWQKIAKKFGDLWDYPFAIGSLDGKHIALRNPANSGSAYYNYKGFPSIVLLALWDADSFFILIDCGQYGRISDAGVFNASRLSTLLEKRELNIPKTSFKVSVSDQTIPHLIIGDEAFPLKSYIMKPFAARTLNAKRRIYYNYRHSRARRTVECAFGILASKFEVFQRPVRVQPDKAVKVIKAAVALHNFIRRREGAMGDRTSTIKYDNVEPNKENFVPLAAIPHSGRATDETVIIRDTISEFFSVPDGAVYWQNDLVFRNVQHQTD